MKKRFCHIFNQKIYRNPLTGTLNELGFEKFAEKRLHRNENVEYIMVVFNIDKYRELSSRYGKEIGEALSDGILKILQEDSKIHVFARTEVDRYLILGEKSLDIISGLNELFQQVVCGLGIQNYVGVVTFIFGAYEIDDKQEDVASMIRKARRAHKSAEKNIFTNLIWYDAGLAQKIEQEKYFNEHLMSGIENGEFKVFLQAQVNLKNPDVYCAESFVRWILPDGRIMYPDTFIPQFETNGMIVHLDYFMIEKVCKYLHELKNNDQPLFRVGINLSNVTLLHQEFITNILGIVDKYEIPHEYIAIEIQEVCFATGELSTLENIKRLRAEGFVIAMDAFASGYSSLRLLPEFPVQIIKLDREFLRSNDRNVKMKIILESIITLAHKLGVMVICEGIEHQKDIDLLKAMECDCVQGYYVMSPMPKEEFLADLESVRNDVKRKIFAE